jgi:hypothetical protein
VRPLAASSSRPAEGGDVHALLGHELAIPDHDPPPVHEGDGALAGDVAELARSLGVDTPLCGMADDGRGQQVLGLVLEGCDQGEQLT